MNTEKRIVLTLGCLTISYILIMTVFYIDYSNSLDNYNQEVYERLNSLQNIIHKVHKEDSELYKSLVSEDLSAPGYSQERYTPEVNHSSNIISELLELKQNELFSSQKIASTINEYYTLEEIKKQIIELQKTTIESREKTYSADLLNLFLQYDEQINKILSDINLEIDVNREKHLVFINQSKKDFIITQIISTLIFIISNIILIYVLVKNETPFSKTKGSKEDLILDSDMQKIISFIKKETSQGNFPTIKELKNYLKISHPTLIIKINELKSKNLISVKKKGRNKHLFLN